MNQHRWFVIKGIEGCVYCGESRMYLESIGRLDFCDGEHSINAPKEADIDEDCR